MPTEGQERCQDCGKRVDEPGVPGICNAFHDSKPEGECCFPSCRCEWSKRHEHCPRYGGTTYGDTEGERMESEEDRWRRVERGLIELRDRLGARQEDRSMLTAAQLVISDMSVELRRLRAERDSDPLAPDTPMERVRLMRWRTSGWVEVADETPDAILDKEGREWGWFVPASLLDTAERRVGEADARLYKAKLAQRDEKDRADRAEALLQRINNLPLQGVEKPTPLLLEIRDFLAETPATPSSSTHQPLQEVTEDE